MSRALLACVVLAAFSAAAVAVETFTQSPVEIPVMDFKAKLDEGRVHLSWRRYKPDDFLTYQLLKSSTKDSPMYPDDPTLFWTRDQDTTNYTDGILSPGVWRYRLCIVTRFGQRWVSPVASITINDKDIRRPPPTSADFE